LSIYQKVDQYIGHLCAAAAADSTILVMSDHGHGGNSAKAIYLNAWLEGHGLLRFRTNRHGKLFPALVEAAKVVGIKVVPSALKRMVFRNTQLANKLESSIRFGRIDWQHTQAYSEETPYFPSIWVNLQGREPDGVVMPGKEYEEVRDEIIDRLCKWTDPSTGERLICNVHRREDLYSGAFVEKFPDLIIEWNRHGNYSYLFKSSASGKRPRTPIRHLDATERGHVKSGDHREHGIFIASGPDIRQPLLLSEAAIIDLAPTILHLMGLPVPASMDGRVLTEVFRPQSKAALPVVYTERLASQPDSSDLPHDYTPDEAEAIRVRLQGLGYIE
jgi:predicted AlkP superfamily phosphohydrolase/phosphomutase